MDMQLKYAMEKKTSAGEKWQNKNKRKKNIVVLYIKRDGVLTRVKPKEKIKIKIKHHG